MKAVPSLILAATCALITACSTAPQPASPGAASPPVAAAQPMEEVTALIGGPDNIVRHETGKRWIPFCFGSDAQRMQTLYRGEGCLTYTAGNVFGGGSNTLIRITATAPPACIE